MACSNLRGGGFGRAIFYCASGLRERLILTTVEPYLDKVRNNRQNDLSDQFLESWQSDELQRDRLRNADFADLLIKRGYGPQAERLRECGSILGFWACGACDEPRKLAQTFCDMPKICPICARIERQQTVAEMKIFIRAIQSKPVHGHRLRHLVLPIKTSGCDEKSLREAVKRIWTAWRKLWRNNLIAPGAGAKVFVEVGSKHGNVHLHGLFYGKWIDQSYLSELWEKYTGDSSVVYVTQGDKSVAEVVKYVTKGLIHVEGENNDELNELVFNSWRAFYKINRRMSYGLFRKDCLEQWINRPVILPKREKPIESLGECPVCKSDSLRYVLGNVFQRGPPFRPVLEVISE